MSFYKKVYKLKITLKSPLSIGSGANEYTDKDVLLDSCDNPFIPGTSLAGVLRNYVKNKYGVTSANTLFGYIPDSREAIGKAEKEDPEFIERKCRIRVYDATLNSDDKAPYITSRDMVALENKVAKDGAKFDMQTVETGAVFVAFLELLESEYAEMIEDALSAMDAGVITLGSKTTRGYGEVSLKAYAKEFKVFDEWVNFDMWDNIHWEDNDEITLNFAEQLKVTFGLALKGGISIREYSTEPGKADYKQLSLHDDGTTPVIPGTSWAGAIRSRFLELCDDKSKVDELFGLVEDKKAQKSNIVISESKFEGGTWKTVTRNAIDRFTGGTKKGALYTAETYYGGNTELVISFRRKPVFDELKCLAACLADLHNGFLAVGGLTAVGRGLFEIVSINGVDISDEEKKPDKVYDVILKSLNSSMQNEEVGSK